MTSVSSGSLLPPDILRLIASMKDLSIADIIHLCKSNQQANNAICNNKPFWVALTQHRWQLDLSREEISQIKMDLYFREQALKYLTDDFEVARHASRADMRRALYSLRIGREEFINNLNTRNITTSPLADIRHYLTIGFIKGVRDLIQDPRINIRTYNYILSIVAQTNPQLLHDVLEDPRYTPVVAFNLMERAQLENNQDVIDILFTYPPAGRMWQPPNWPGEDWRLPYAEE